MIAKTTLMVLARTRRSSHPGPRPRANAKRFFLK